MNSQNLIPVFNGKISHSETLLCNARKLHEFLQVKTRYSQWLKERIAEYGFLENQDFVIASEISEAKRGVADTIKPNTTSLWTWQKNWQW